MVCAQRIVTPQGTYVTTRVIGGPQLTYEQLAAQRRRKARILFFGVILPVLCVTVVGIIVYITIRPEPSANSGGRTPLGT